METRLKWRFNLPQGSDRKLQPDERCLALVTAESMDSYFLWSERRALKILIARRVDSGTLISQLLCISSLSRMGGSKVATSRTAAQLISNPYQGYRRFRSVVS
jgi:hypothetical protein